MLNRHLRIRPSPSSTATLYHIYQRLQLPRPCHQATQPATIAGYRSASQGSNFTSTDMGVSDNQNQHQSSAESDDHSSDLATNSLNKMTAEGRKKGLVSEASILPPFKYRRRFKLHIPFALAESSDRNLNKKWEFQSVSDLMSGTPCKPIKPKYIPRKRRIKPNYQVKSLMPVSVPEPMSPQDIKGISQSIIKLYYAYKFLPCKNIDTSSFFSISYFSPLNFVGTFRPFQVSTTVLFNRNINLNEREVSQEIKGKFTKSMAPYDYTHYRKKIVKIYRDVLFQMYQDHGLPKGFYLITVHKFPTLENFGDFESDLRNMRNSVSNINTQNKMTTKVSNDKVKWEQLERWCENAGLEVPSETLKLREKILQKKDYLELSVETNSDVRNSEDYKSKNTDYKLPYGEHFMARKSKDYKPREMKYHERRTAELQISNQLLQIKCSLAEYKRQGKYMFDFIDATTKTSLKIFNVWFLHVRDVKEDAMLEKEINQFIEGFLKMIRVERLLELKSGRYTFEIDLVKLREIMGDQLSESEFEKLGKELFESFMKTFDVNKQMDINGTTQRINDLLEDQRKVETPTSKPKTDVKPVNLSKIKRYAKPRKVIPSSLLEASLEKNRSNLQKLVKDIERSKVKTQIN